MLAPKGQAGRLQRRALSRLCSPCSCPSRRLSGPPSSASSPFKSLYMDMGMVMIPKKGVPRDGAMGGSIVSVSVTKPVAVAVWFGL